MTFQKSSTARTIIMFLAFSKRTLLEYDSLDFYMRLIIFQIRSGVQSIFNAVISLGKRITAIVSRPSSKGLGTPEVKIAPEVNIALTTKSSKRNVKLSF